MDYSLLEPLNEYLIAELDCDNDISKWTEKYSNDYAFLFDLFDAIEEENDITDQNNNIKYEKRDDIWSITSDTFDFEIDEITIRKVVQLTADMLTPILPLGTVVDLKKDVMEKDFSIENVENFRFVITERLLYLEDGEMYMPYGGKIYPLGNFAGEESLYFTDALIDEVVYKGFADEVEEQFVNAIKNELILKKGMCSIAFAKEELKEKIAEALKEEHADE